MTTIHHIEDLPRFPSPHHLAIGVFDGWHVGHQAVWARAETHARSSGGTAILVTFDPHPRGVLSPGNAPPILTHTAHKLRITARMGVGAALVVGFDRAFAAQEGSAFIGALHRHSPALAEICVGRDWQFGRGRTGNFTRLQELGRELGFTATGIDPVILDGQVVSSTRVRELVRGGELDAAKRLLGREYSVFGTVVPGKRLGRQLGFPTANVESANEQLPPDGVYAVTVLKGEDELPGVANLGKRPTMDGDSRSRLEVHLLDHPDGEFYGEELEVWFARKLRPEMKFPDLDTLVSQIRRDAVQARAALRG